MVEDGYLTVSDLASKLKVSRQWVYRQVKAGKIPHVRIGGKGQGMVRFIKEDVEKWLRSTTETG